MGFGDTRDTSGRIQFHECTQLGSPGMILFLSPSTRFVLRVCCLLDDSETCTCTMVDRYISRDHSRSGHATLVQPLSTRGLFFLICFLSTSVDLFIPFGYSHFRVRQYELTVAVYAAFSYTRSICVGYRLTLFTYVCLLPV